MVGANARRRKASDVKSKTVDACSPIVERFLACQAVVSNENQAREVLIAGCVEDVSCSIRSAKVQARQRHPGWLSDHPRWEDALALNGLNVAT
jgi:hypothetical protein